MMKRMRTWRWVSAAVLLAAGGTAGRAEGFAIQWFDGTGKLVFAPVPGATNYEVRTSAAVTGGWSVAGSVAPTAGHALTTTVSVAGSAGFYNVVALTNAAPPPDGLYMVVDLSAGSSAASYPVTYLSAVPPGGWTDEYKTTKLVLRRIPAGTFSMGSPVGEVGREYAIGDETQHEVTLTQPFYIGVFEVTQKQWERVMGNWPSWFNNTTCRDSRPVEQVSYYDIRENPANSDDPAANWPANSVVNADSFMGKLRAKTGLSTFDLPTESQWEYACRAGTTTALNSGKNLTSPNQCPNVSEVGRYWYNGPSSIGYAQSVDTSGGTAKAGSHLPNAWGLYDMHGNAWEWCLDWFPGSRVDRMHRGGGWGSLARECRSAPRDDAYPASDGYYFGFRVARTLP